MTAQNSPSETNELSTSAPLLIAVVIVILLAIFIRFSLNPTASIPAVESNKVFSAERAKSMLGEVLADETPHPLDSREIRFTEKRLIKVLRTMGYQEEIQEASVCRDFKQRGVRCTQVRNIIVTIAGADDSNDTNAGILLAAHYDSVDAGPGANDAGVAVATLLETARLLSTLPQPKNTIVLLFNEGEEYGLLGAQAFMQQHPLAKKLKLAINVEARGSSGQSVMFETGENSAWLVNEYRKHTSKPLSSSLFYEVYKILPNDTDLTVFKEHGLQGLNFAHAETLIHYHTPLDNLQNLSLKTLQHHGDNVWGVLNAIKDSDLSSDNLDESNLVYTDILGLFMLQWHEPMSWVLSLLALGMFCIAVVRLKKADQLSLASVRTGFYLFLLLLLVTPAVAFLVQWFSSLLSSVTRPWLTNSLPMQVALWSAMAIVGISLSSRLSRNKNVLSMLLGLVACWLFMAIVSTAFAAGISYLFIIPCLVSTLILLPYSVLSSHLRQRFLYVVCIVHLVSVTVMFLPVVYTLEIMLTYQMSVAIGLMFAFVLIAIVPVTAIGQHKGAQIRGVQMALTAAFLIGFIWTLMQAPFDQASPQRINLYHVQNHDGQSKIVVASRSKPLPESLDTIMDYPKKTQVLAWSERERYSVAVDYVDLNEAIISKTVQTLSEGIEVSLSVSAKDENLRGVTFHIKQSPDISEVSFFGQQYDLQGRDTVNNGYYTFNCVGLACRTSGLKIKKSGREKIEVLILKTVTGLPEQDAKYTQNRGAVAHQYQFGDQSMIISKIEI